MSMSTPLTAVTTSYPGITVTFTVTLDPSVLSSSSSPATKTDAVAEGTIGQCDEGEGQRSDVIMKNGKWVKLSSLPLAPESSPSPTPSSTPSSSSSSTTTKAHAVSEGTISQCDESEGQCSAVIMKNGKWVKL